MSTIRAAVVTEPGEVSTEEVTLDDPKPDEVLVDLRAAGVCHTDYHFFTGDLDVPMPVVLGHEGAGIVERTGDRVSAVEPGDHVVLSLLSPCGSCEYCRTGRPYLCGDALDVRFRGTLADGTRRLHRGGEEINHFYAQSSFATKAVVPEASAVRVPEAVPFDRAALLGCGASTGIGGVVNTADVSSGESVAIFGCGGTGASAVLGATAVSADPVIAIDVVPDKLERAASLGATHTVNPARSDPVERIEELTGGGVEYAFDFVGYTSEVRRQAIAATRRGGSVVLSGGAEEGETVDVSDLLDGGKTLATNVAGSFRPHVDVPRYARLYLNGDLDLDSLLTRTYPLEDLEEAFEALSNGEVIKSALVYD